MRLLPDPDLSFRDAVDYIFDGPLCRCALQNPHPPDLALFVREAAQFIHRLTVSCHLPEFTDHGLSHLCSLLERIGNWTVNTPSGDTVPIVEQLSIEESALLLIAVLFHDIGMLSQRPDDLAETTGVLEGKSMNDVPNWVRMTHIARINGVVQLGLSTRSGTHPSDVFIQRAIRIAQAHGSWPWEENFLELTTRDAALAAILSVADLLDEDANRCDTLTLLNHRQGTQLNRAHWIRHGLTQGRVRISSNRIIVKLVTLPDAESITMAPVFAALRNHYRLALLYKEKLAPVMAGGLSVEFSPFTGVPSEINDDLTAWNSIPSFSTAQALGFQLLNTFMPIALCDSQTATSLQISHGNEISLEPVDLEYFHRLRGNTELRSPFEQVARALET